MTCLVCKSGNYKGDFSTEITKIVLAMAEEAYSMGAEVEVRRFVA